MVDMAVRERKEVVLKLQQLVQLLLGSKCLTTHIFGDYINIEYQDWDCSSRVKQRVERRNYS